MVKKLQLLNRPKCSETDYFGRTQCSEYSEQPLGSEFRKVAEIISDSSQVLATHRSGV
jgi:hypothetical protein